MTNEITLAKQQFSDVLDTAGIRILSYVPERVTPPIVIVNSGSPYLTADSIDNEFILSLELVCIAATATNKQASEKLDELIQDVIGALPQYAKLGSVGQPYLWATNNAEYLTSSISVDLRITL